MKLIKILYCFSLLSLIGAPVVVSADAQEQEDVITETIQAEVEFNPLETADTSSPRDTLRSFLRDVNIALDDWLQAERQSSSSLVSTSQPFEPTSALFQPSISARPRTAMPGVLSRVEH